MQEKGKRRLKWFLQVGFTLVLLGYLVSRIPVSRVWEILQDASLPLLLAGYFLQLLMRLSATFRIKILVAAQNIRLKLAKLFEISLISTFYSLCLPGEIGGGAIRWHRISGPDAKPAEALFAIAVDRTVDTLALLAIGFLFWWVDPMAHRQGPLGWALGGMLGSLCLIQAVVMLPPVTDAIKSRLPEKGIAGLIGSKIGKLISAAQRYRSVSWHLRIQVFLFSLLRHAIGIYSVYLLAMAVDLPLNWVQVAWIRSIMIILTMLPISWAGLGVREVSLLVLLEPYGVPEPMALAWSFLLFLRVIWIGGLGGVLELNRVLRGRPAVKIKK